MTSVIKCWNCKTVYFDIGKDICPFCKQSKYSPKNNKFEGTPFEDIFNQWFPKGE